MQALIYHHPEDKVCWHVDDEYYFGDDFLVAPVMNSEDVRDIYLPKGEWIDFFNGENITVSGSTGSPQVIGKWIHKENISLQVMPVYVRKGAKIPIYPKHVENTDEMDINAAEWLIIDENFTGYKL